MNNRSSSVTFSKLLATKGRSTSGVSLNQVFMKKGTSLTSGKFGLKSDTNSKVLGSRSSGGNKRSLHEVLNTKCSLEPPRKKNHTMVQKRQTSISILELRSEHKRLMGGMATKHPAIMEADKENQQLTKKIRRVEEMAQFWKRKSISLAEDLDKSRTEISMLRDKLEGVESERLQLHSKLLAAQQDNSQCMKAIKSLMSENENLKFVVKSVNQELKLASEFRAEVEEKCDVSMAETEDEPPADMETCKELEEALEETLADLSERLEEIEELKTALAKTTVERDQLQQVVSREVMQSAIASLDGEETETNSTQSRIAKLQGQVEKCMFRIAVLTQKNEELKKITMDGSDDMDLLRTLEDSQKLEILESLCMQKYRKILRQTAATLVETGEDEDLADESFNLDPTACVASETTSLDESFGI